MRISFGKTNRIFWIGANLLVFAQFNIGLHVNAQSRPIPRKIIALYKASEGFTEDTNPIYNHVQLPLNNLGLIVEYFDAEDLLPPVDELDEFRGIVIWFNSHEMINAARYRLWLRRAILSGKRIVILGGLGAYRERGKSISPIDRAEVRSIYRLLGLNSHLKARINREAKIVTKDNNYYDFEAKMRPDLINYLWDIQSVSSDNKILLSLADGTGEYHAAVLTDRGAFIGAGAFLEWSEASKTPQWLINPTQLFYDAFDCQNLPIAELNTTGGRRTAFMHIDGDGFSTISKIDRWHICGQLVNDRVLKKFDLPFSVSIITSEVDPDYNGNRRTLETAREIFRHPHIEPASHGFSHPHDWRKKKLSLDVGESYDFDPIMETQTSISFIQDELLSPGKKISLFFWTGMCNPRWSDIDLVESQGWLQMNGGAGKLYAGHPSMSTFYPPYAQVGAGHRINSRISNEYEFTNKWLGPHDGYKNVIESIEFTGGERPVTPANIYFHYYIMEWEDGWRSLRQVLRWVEQQPFTIMYASDYIQSVKDFLTAKIYRESADEFGIETAGALRTIRFRNERRDVDLSRSSNIVGFVKTRNDLLVHLDAHKTHRISLGENDRRVPHITYANQLIDSIAVDNKGADIAVRGYGEFKATLNGLEPSQYFEIKTSSAIPNMSDSYQNAATVPMAGFRVNRVQFAKSDENGSLSFNTFTRNKTKIEISMASSFNYALTRSKGWLFILILSGFIWLQLRMARTYLAFRLSRIVRNRENRVREFLT